MFGGNAMKKKSFLILSMFVVGCFISQAMAGSDIYKHIDKEGNITFTNRKIPNAEKISLASYSPHTSKTTASKATGSNISRSSNSSQNERNVMRRKILENELIAEQQLLSTTKNFLNQIASEPKPEDYQQRVVQLKNKLFMHHRNIAALKKEIARY